MANERQLLMLKRSIKEWNEWFENNPGTLIDFSNSNLTYSKLNEAHLSRADFSNSNLSNTFLNDADLFKANLNKTNLRNSNLVRANLNMAKLEYANLRHTSLIDAKLYKANLSRAQLHNANFDSANLCMANLSYANLLNANLFRANLKDSILNNTNFSRSKLNGGDLTNAKLENADMSMAKFGNTNLSNLDLRLVRGLEKSTHFGPSIIGYSTVKLSKGEIPRIFLEGCGLRDWEIKSIELYKEGLSDMDIENIVYEIAQLKMGDPIQLHNLFISYSHTNHEFVDALEPYLKNESIRFWRDTHDGIAGPMDKMVLRAMENRTVLLIFSEESINSDWVEFEVENARKLEKEYGRNVLCPIAIDTSWKDANWSPILMNQVKKYNVLDFSDWKNKQQMRGQFNRLLKGLDIFYKK